MTNGFDQISLCLEVGLERFERFRTAILVVASGFGQISVCVELDLDNFGQRLEGIRRRFRVVWVRVWCQLKSGWSVLERCDGS